MGIAGLGGQAHVGLEAGALPFMKRATLLDAACTSGLRTSNVKWKPMAVRWDKGARAQRLPQRVEVSASWVGSCA